MSCVLSSADVESRAESATSNSSTAPLSRSVTEQPPLRMRTRPTIGTTTSARRQMRVACERHSALAFTEDQHIARSDLWMLLE